MSDLILELPIGQDFDIPKEMVQKFVQFTKELPENIMHIPVLLNYDAEIFMQQVSEKEIKTDDEKYIGTIYKLEYVEETGSMLSSINFYETKKEQIISILTDDTINLSIQPIIVPFEISGIALLAVIVNTNSA